MNRAHRISPCCTASFVAAWRRSYAFRIIRIPKANVEVDRYRRIHRDLVSLEELKSASRLQIALIYQALRDGEVLKSLDRDYLEGVISRTVALKHHLLPEDYTLFLKSIRNAQNFPPGYKTQLNEGIKRISSNFSQKQIAIIIRSYAALSSRSVSTISELVSTFNKNISDAEIWQLRDIASSLATLCVKPTGAIEHFYKATVAILQKHLKSISTDDIGVFLNSFVRQNIAHNEILHYVDIHAMKLIREASNKNVALIANAFARANKTSSNLINAVTTRLENELKLFLEGKGTSNSMNEVRSATDGIEKEEAARFVLGGSCENSSSNPATEVVFGTASEAKVAKPADTQKDALNIVDVAMSFNALTKLEGYTDKLLNAYILWVTQHIKMETPTLSLVLLAHAYSQAGVFNKEVFIKIAHVLVRRINLLNHQHLGVLALSFAKAGQKIPLLFLRIADEVIYRGTVALKFKRYYFDLQSLEHLMQAFSRIDFKDQRLYAVLTTLLKRRLRTAQSDELHGETIASMLTSMSQRNVDNFAPLIMEHISKRKGSATYSTHALCRVVSAFCKLKVRPTKILDYMLKEAKSRVNEFQIPVLINTLKAFAKHKCYDESMIRDCLKRFSLHLVHLSTQDIANLLLALSDYGYRNVTFIQKLIMCIKHRMAELNRSQLHMVFTRLAMLRSSDPDLYKELIARIIEKAQEFNEVQVGEICVSYIYILVHFDYLQREIKLQKGIPELNRKYMEALDKQGMKVGEIVNPPNEDGKAASPDDGTGIPMFANCPITNLAPYEFDDSILDVMLTKLGTELDVATIFKVQTVRYYLEYARMDIYGKLSKEAIDIMKKCCGVKFSLAEYLLTSSSVHREVSHLLNMMGVYHRNEVQFGPYLIDLVPETGANQRVAIEYDGPSHFYAETIMRTAKSILKHEILEGAGWHVIHLPYQEWSQLVSKKQKVIYLSQFIAQYDAGCNRVASKTMNSDTSQKRSFSTALKRKRRQLDRINEEILQQYLGMPDTSSEDPIEPRETAAPSSTDRIEDEICHSLMEGNKSIRDLDQEDEEQNIRSGKESTLEDKQPNSEK